MSHEFHIKYRPKTLAEVVGQPEAVKTLERFISKGNLPHALLFHGQSGVGKTTMVRILRKAIGCHRNDFMEINAASDRSIDVVREVEQRVGMSALFGKSRAWLFDEVHHLSRRSDGDAQTALLKVVEDVPNHVYFFLATTDPNGLRDTLRSRCTPIALHPISNAILAKLVLDVAAKENVSPPVTNKLADQIAEAAEGSARMALNHLNRVAMLKDDNERQNAVVKASTKRQAYDLVKAMVFNWQRVKWEDVAKIITEIEDEPETVRRQVLGLATKAVLEGKNMNRAMYVIDCFEGNFYDSGKAGLVRACWEVFKVKGG